jgi:hypothetical protein
LTLRCVYLFVFGCEIPDDDGGDDDDDDEDDDDDDDDDDEGGTLIVFGARKTRQSTG